MKIKVRSSATMEFAPDLIKLSLSFNKKDKLYENAMTLGTNEVKLVFDLLSKFGIDKKNIISQNPSVYENQTYNETLKKYEKDGFSYHQNAIITLKYDIQLLSKILEKIAKLENPPTYNINFELEHPELHHNEVIDKAYKKALDKANAIIKTSGVKGNLICEEININCDDYNSNVMYSKCSDFSRSASPNSIQTNLVEIISPKNIEISQTLDCIFKAE